MSTLAGPMSKGTHSGGKTFAPKLSHKGSGSWKNFTNSCESDKNSITGLKYSSGSMKGNPTALAKKPSGE